MPSLPFALALAFALAAGCANAALVTSNLNYNTTSYNDGVTRATTAVVTRRDDIGAGSRPVIMVMPGWGGVGDPQATQDGYAVMYANAGYIAMNIGFHQTGSAPGSGPVSWYSDLAESAKGALDAVCAQAYANCGAVVITGGSYGGTQTHPVVRFLHGNNTYNGTGGANAGKRVVAILSQDAGYTLHWAAPVDADATAYSIALIENQGDSTFPMDSCNFGNCGVRNRGDYHQGAAGSQYVLTQCPAGGEHGTRGYADWDAWVLSALKTMLHSHRGVPTFAGYVGPSLAVSNACVTNAPAGFDVAVSQAASPGTANTGKDVSFTYTIQNLGPNTAPGVVVSNPIPASTGLVWIGPGCGHNGVTVTCSLGDLVAGASVVRQVVLRPTAAGSFTNTVSVAAAQADPLPNNSASLQVPVNASPAGVAVARYRLYSDVTKEHHFTTDANEYNVLGGFGWVQEGTVGKILNNPGAHNGVNAVPYYRLYDAGTRWHHWTTDPNEYYTLGSIGWTMEGVDGYILPTQAPGTIPLYRLNYPALGSLHHWTIDANEYNVLTTQYGWVGEGGSGFVIP